MSLALHGLALDVRRPYRGLAFYTTSEQPLVLPGRTELISAKSISVPDVRTGPLRAHPGVPIDHPLL